MLHNLEVDFYGASRGRTLRLRYEDWVEEPDRALAAIRRFAGIARPAERLAPDAG